MRPINSEFSIVVLFLNISQIDDTLVWMDNSNSSDIDWKRSRLFITIRRTDARSIRPENSTFQWGWWAEGIHFEFNWKSSAFRNNVCVMRIGSPWGSGQLVNLLSIAQCTIRHKSQMSFWHAGVCWKYVVGFVPKVDKVRCIGNEECNVRAWYVTLLDFLNKDRVCDRLHRASIGKWSTTLFSNKCAGFTGALLLCSFVFVRLAQSSRRQFYNGGQFDSYAIRPLEIMLDNTPMWSKYTIYFHGGLLWGR